MLRVSTNQMQIKTRMNTTDVVGVFKDRVRIITPAHVCTNFPKKNLEATSIFKVPTWIHEAIIRPG